MSKKVELSTLMKFFSIFVEKRWVAIDGYADVLNRFGELVDALKEEEIELIIDLTEKYYWMTYNDYHTSLRSLLIQLLAGNLSKKKKLYVFPIIKPTDEKKTKSGHAVMYMLDAIKSSITGFNNIEFVLLQEFEQLNSINLSGQDFLILVDDYVGTGKTLNSTLVEANKNTSINNNFAILTIAIQVDAKSLLDSKKINNYSKLILHKGISGHYNSPELEERLAIMKRIENRIPKVTKFRYGFEKSEALITLIRTPNNTFPIFWKGINYKGVEIEAPFQRH